MKQTIGYTPSPAAAPLIVYEWSGRWATLFQRMLNPATTRQRRAPVLRTRLRVVSCRSASECLERVVEFPAAFVAVELASGRIDAALRLLDDLAVGHRGAATAVVAERGLAHYEPLVRELGAVAMAMTPADARLVCDVVRRRARRIDRERRTASAALSPADWSQQLLAELPWG